MTDSSEIYKGYEGRKEIMDFITNTKQPTFSKFIHKHSSEIPLWSLKCVDTNAHSLHRTWSSRFVSGLRYLKPHAQVPALSMTKEYREYWEAANKRIKVLTMMDTAYTSSSIQTLTDYAETARAMASMVQRSTVQQLGKRMRQNNSGVDDDENDSDNTEKKAGNMDNDTATLDNDGNSNNIPLLHDDEKLGTLKTAIFNLGYKKQGKLWIENDRELLDLIREKPFLDLHPPLTHHITHILNGELTNDDIYRLKLSLSGIVNTICRADYDHVRPFLPTNNLDERLDAIVSKFRSRTITGETKALLQQVINKFKQGGSVEETMVLVHDLQRPLLLSKRCASQSYRALDAVLAILKCMGFNSNSDTEDMVLHRFMTILSTVFSNNTNIRLVEGETISASCTKRIQRVNSALYEASHKQSHGRKIDILVKHNQGCNKYIELSSLEVKSTNAGATMVRDQQNKNLRTNGAILSYLCSLNPGCHTLQTTAAIDLVGAAGYVYIMTNVNGIFYARQVGLIMLPKSRSTFIDLLETLDLLFAFESFMVDLGQEAQAAMERRESLDNICKVANVIQQTVPSIEHDIFITPTRPK